MNLSEGVQFVSLLILTAVLIASALGVVLIANIVYSAFLLGLVFLCISGMYILLNADFVAAAQVLIYVGAVNVLILFAIMLVNRRQPYRPSKSGDWPTIVTGVVCFALFGLLLFTVTTTVWFVTPGAVPLDSTIVTLGMHFFTDYLLPFELVSVLLLVALIGAIILARREYIPDQTKPEEALELLERPKEQLVGVEE